MLRYSHDVEVDAKGTERAQGPERPPKVRDVALYRIAYEEVQRAVDDQVDELNGVRQRGVQYLAFVGSATAFLVGASLKAVERTAGFYWVAGFATLISLLTLAALIRVLVPWGAWEYRLSGRRLIDGWIESEVPAPNEAHLIRALTLRYDEMRSRNEGALRKIRRTYLAEIVFGTFQLILWVSLTWLAG